MSYQELYRQCYDIIKHGAPNREGYKPCIGHQLFANYIPKPDQVSEADAKILTSLIVISPSNRYGLEGFFPYALSDGKMVGEIVKENHPDYRNQDKKEVEILCAKILFPTLF